MWDQLVGNELKSHLGNAIIGREIIVLEQTASTNDAILQVATHQGAAISSGAVALAKAASPPSSFVNEGFVLFAEHQTAGRGQRGNRWESAAGKGLWFSILLRPKIKIASSPQLTAWAAEDISGAIENEFFLTATIKLPNDVQIDECKVAGVLVEMRA